MSLQVNFNTKELDRQFKELERTLDALPKSMAKAQLRAATRKAMAPVAKEAKQRLRNSSWDSNEAAQTVRVYPLKRTRVPASVAVSTDSDHWKAALFEYGFHYRPYGNERLPLKYRPPEPWLRPAWDSNINKVKENIASDLWYVLQRTAARLERQAKAGKLSKSGMKALGL